MLVKSAKRLLVIIAAVVSVFGAMSMYSSDLVVGNVTVPVKWDVVCEFDAHNNLVKRTCKAPGTYDFCPSCRGQ